MHVAHRRRGIRTMAALTAFLALGVATASPAFAHGAEKNVPAVTLVQEAIAIARSDPQLMDSVADKINDALDSNEQANVNLGLVREAQAALEAGDMAKVELLLEQSIGACPGEPVVAPGGLRTPQPITTPCPKPAHLNELPGTPVGGTAEPVLLSLAGAFVLAGLLLARKIR